jgi:hypothetical protein
VSSSNLEFEAVSFLDRPGRKALQLSKRSSIHYLVATGKASRESFRGSARILNYKAVEYSESPKAECVSPRDPNDTVVVTCLQQSRFGSIQKAV